MNKNQDIIPVSVQRGGGFCFLPEQEASASQR